MLICDHRFGFKRRDDSGYYCPLCRVSVTLDKGGKGVKDVEWQKGDEWKIALSYLGITEET